jgi:hypothetical protein
MRNRRAQQIRTPSEEHSSSVSSDMYFWRRACGVGTHGMVGKWTACVMEVAVSGNL